jgi:VanZ family protein
MRWLRHRWPVFVWAAVIWIFSTSWFSAESISPFLFPLLHFLFPHASAQGISLLHTVIRKSAHLAEYALFSLLILRAIRGERREWHVRWAVAAVAIAAGYAATDELHQAFLFSRTPSMIDVLLDTSGAVVAQLWLAWRAHRIGDALRGTKSSATQLHPEASIGLAATRGTDDQEER